MSMDCLRSSRRARRGVLTTPLCVALCAALLLATPAPAQDAGTVLGRVIDAETGLAVEGATVIVIWPQPEDGSQARQEVQTTDGEGAFEFPSIPAGRYTISFVKSGYRSSTLTNVEVQAGQQSRADFPLPPLPSDDASGEILELEAFVVEASTVNELLASLELRLESDQLLNIMTAEDLSKFAAADVAEALKRVAGVNIVEGQFAIIRGLEDRYSSALYNSAPVPSPDPDRQSVQLDLFPSEIVSNLVVAKTFGPELPGNSAAGSLDIVTSGHPESEGLFDAKVYAKTGLNQNAWNEFLQFQSGSPMGNPTSGSDVLEQEYGGFLGGHTELFGREVRYKAIGNWGTDYETAEGFQEGRAPGTSDRSSPHRPLGDLAFGELNLTSGRFDLTDSLYEEQLTAYGGFGFDLDEAGHHKIDAAVFWTRKDEEEVELRENGYLPGFDYGRIISDMEEGQDIRPSPNFIGDAGAGRNASPDAWIVNAIGAREFPFDDSATRGAAWFSSFSQSRSFDTRRDLRVYQVNGDHDAGSLLPGLHFRWAGNYATTSQDEQALGARYRYEPCGSSADPALACPPAVTPIRTPGQIPTTLPITVDALGPGTYMVNRDLFASFNKIDEEQYFGRVDGSYETDPFAWLRAELQTGFWYEHATRNVDADFLFAKDINIGSGSRCSATGFCIGSGSQFAILGDTPQELGEHIFASNLLRDAGGSLQALRFTQSEATREIEAWSFGAKATLWQQLDLLGGFRLEKILIESKNDPFIPGFALDGSPQIFPSKYLLFDRMDNPRRREVTRIPPYNDQILGIDVPSGPCRDPNGNVIPNGGDCVDLIDLDEIEPLINGRIDQTYVLPAAGLAYRPYPWLTLRGAWSQTVARPSFREIGYYVSAEPGTDELSIGNPQLQLSEVESWDARAEFVWGELGDLFAVSGFYKTVQDPIEQIIVRDPAVFDTVSPALYRTFFNNPNQATLWGIEVEGRKNLGFLGPEFLSHLSVGGNFTWIDAQVDRSEFELARSERFFGSPAEPVPFPSLASTRRLYNQPEWIANADLSFDQPDWGTKATVAFFAISDVLDAAGGATEFELTSGGRPTAYTLDRYVDSFYQLDLIVSQNLWRGLALKLTLKNLTDSERGILYDPAQTSQEIAERRYRVGRDFSLALSWAFSGPEL